MLETLIQEERKQLYEEGKAQGIMQGKIEDAKRMLAKDLPLELIAEITGLSEETIIQLKTELQESS